MRGCARGLEGRHELTRVRKHRPRAAQSKCPRCQWLQSEAWPRKHRPRSSPSSPSWASKKILCKSRHETENPAADDESAKRTNLTETARSDSNFSEKPSPAKVSSNWSRIAKRHYNEKPDWGKAVDAAAPWPTWRQTVVPR